jgi:hypothetical protein
MQKSTNSADIGQALLKCYEPAIHGTTAATVLRAPWIVLCHGAISSDADPDAKSQEE